MVSSCQTKIRKNFLEEKSLQFKYQLEALFNAVTATFIAIGGSKLRTTNGFFVPRYSLTSSRFPAQQILLYLPNRCPRKIIDKAKLLGHFKVR